ncbi:MAG: hypothetical protein IPK76_18700 [Lewinellaceae bacterium]|nr:hypothetical protein [Lewinellaceae bacterium]
MSHEKRNEENQYAPTDSIIDQAIDKFMNQNNENKDSGTQFNNLAKHQSIGSQIGTQNNYFDSSNPNSSKIDGARTVNQDFAKIISQFSQKASPPTKDVIDFRNELKERVERDVILIPIKHLRFRKTMGES